MKTLSEVLRDADPLLDESRTEEARQALRQVILAAPSTTTRRRRNVRALVPIAAVAVIGLLAAVFAWKHASIDAVAAVRFEARLADDHERIVDNTDIVTAEVVPGSTPTTFGVSLTFTPEGAARMRRVTADHLGERLEILIDDDVVMTPVIRSPISNVGLLSGTFTYSEAMRIVNGVLQGKLEVRTK